MKHKLSVLWSLIVVVVDVAIVGTAVYQIAEVVQNIIKNGDITLDLYQELMGAFIYLFIISVFSYQAINELVRFFKKSGEM